MIPILRKSDARNFMIANTHEFNAPIIGKLCESNSCNDMDAKIDAFNARIIAERRQNTKKARCFRRALFFAQPSVRPIGFRPAAFGAVCSGYASPLTREYAQLGQSKLSDLPRRTISKWLSLQFGHISSVGSFHVE